MIAWVLQEASKPKPGGSGALLLIAFVLVVWYLIKGVK